MKIEFKKYLKSNICKDTKEIEYFLKGEFEKNKTLIISFDDIDFDIKDINFTKLFKSLSNLKNLTFTFNNTIFNSHISFDKLECKKLIFYKTTFRYGGSFKKSTITRIIYFPKELNSDVIFDKCEICFFKYKNQLKGDCFTRFYDIVFEKKADFRKTILDKVHFENQNMENIYLLESKVDETILKNCDFNNDNKLYPHYQYKRLVISISLLAFFYFTINSIPIFLFLSLPFLPMVLEGISIILIKILHKISNIFNFATSKIKSKEAFTEGYLIIADEKEIRNFSKFTIQFDILKYKILYIFSLNNKQKLSPELYRKLNKVKYISDKKIQMQEIYRQLGLNYENNKNFQKMMDFNYTSKHLTHLTNSNYSTIDSLIIYPFHHFINSFGINWLKPLIWFTLTIFIFSITTMLNIDYISTKSTPPFLLNAYNKQKNLLEFDFNNLQNDYIFYDKAHFMRIAKTNNKNTTNTYAYDNRFNFEYTKQYIPMLKNEFIVNFYYSLSHFISPFVSENKKWFEKRTHKAVWLGVLETILLWLFFGAFILAVKNRIKR